MAPSDPKTPPAAPDPDDHVVVGVVTGAWGLRGDLKVESHTDHPDRFVPGGVLYLDNQPCRILRSRPHKAGCVVGLDAVSDRTAAERLRGKPLTVPASDLPKLAVDTFFYFDVIDMAVRTTGGHDLGQVSEILSTGGNDVYLIRRPGTEILIPAVQEYVAHVDLERGVMTVRLPDGYLEEMARPRAGF